MPNDSEHLALARRDQELIDHLLPDINRFSEWVVVVAFYKAQQIVEAVFFKTNAAKHGQNHENRERLLKTDRRYQQIYKYYRPLWAASAVARYLEDHSSRKEYRSFHDFMPPDQVQATVINHYLHQIEKSA
jgi:hypothetical protein